MLLSVNELNKSQGWIFCNSLSVKLLHNCLWLFVWLCGDIPLATPRGTHLSELIHLLLHGLGRVGVVKHQVTRHHLLSLAKHAGWKMAPFDWPTLLQQRVDHLLIPFTLLLDHLTHTFPELQHLQVAPHADESYVDQFSRMCHPVLFLKTHVHLLHAVVDQRLNRFVEYDVCVRHSHYLVGETVLHLVDDQVDFGEPAAHASTYLRSVACWCDSGVCSVQLAVGVDLCGVDHHRVPSVLERLFEVVLHLRPIIIIVVEQFHVTIYTSCSVCNT